MSPFSFQKILEIATKSFIRFPFPILLSIFLCASFNIYFFSKIIFFKHLTFIFLLAIPLYISLGLLLERYEAPNNIVLVVNLLFLLIFTLLQLNTPFNDFYQKHLYRYIFLFISFVASIFYLPFLGFKDNTMFWFYNKAILKRSFTALVYSIILILGLSMLLWTLVEFQLFSLDIQKLVFFISFNVFSLFFIWFFVSGIPSSKIYETNFITHYPFSLLSLTTNLLFPLYIVFSAILLVGLIIKVLIQQDTSFYYILLKLIILNLFMNIIITIFSHPVLFKHENKKFLRLIYYSIIFSFILLFFLFYLLYSVFNSSIYFINRYIYLYFGVILLTIYLYFLYSHLKDLRIIPFSIMIFSLLFVAGPWNFLSIYKKTLIKEIKSNINNNELKNFYISLYGKSDFYKKLKKSKIISPNIHKTKTQIYDKIFSYDKPFFFKIDDKKTIIGIKFKHGKISQSVLLDPNKKLEFHFNLYTNDLYIYLNNENEAQINLKEFIAHNITKTQDSLLLMYPLKINFTGKSFNYTLFLDVVAVKIINIKKLIFNVEQVNFIILTEKKF